MERWSKATAGKHIELLDSYLEALQEYYPIEKDEFSSRLRHFVLFRTLQVLGAYGFRGYFGRLFQENPQRTGQVR